MFSSCDAWCVVAPRDLSQWADSHPQGPAPPSSEATLWSGLPHSFPSLNGGSIITGAPGDVSIHDSQRASVTLLRHHYHLHNWRIGG